MTPKRPTTQSEASQRNYSPNSAVKTTTTLSVSCSMNTPTKLSHYAHQVMKCGCGFAFGCIGWLRVNSRGKHAISVHEHKRSSRAFPQKA